MQYLEKLNPEQKNAVTEIDGPILIIAGAGAGKTRTITYRIAHLIYKGIEPKNILAVTFTNKAANEMNERVNYILNNYQEFKSPISFHERPHIYTFHSLGVQILRNHADKIGYKKSFSIYDRDDSKKVVRDIIKELSFDPKEIEPGKVLSVISKNKGDMIDSYKFEDGAPNNYFGQNISQIWRRYDARLKEENAFDFDDLLSKTFELLQKNPEVRKAYQDLFKFIHIDEYQDTNNLQYEITKILADNHKNICVVGDIDQNIYSWRGASIKNMMNFNTDYPDAKVIKLEENYRSTKNILAVANNIISKNNNRLPKNLFTKNHDGEKITIYNAIDEYEEASFIINEAKRLIEEGTKPNQIALLFRANFQSRVLEEVCLREKIPHQVLGTRFFDRKEIKDVVSYLKSALNRDDFSNLSRIINEPKRGIGKTTLLKIKMKKMDEFNSATKEKILSFKRILDDIKESAQKNKLSETIALIIERSGMQDNLSKQGDDGKERMDNLKELVSLAQKYDLLGSEDGVNKFLEDVALATDQDSLSKDNGGIKLMTIHASKGLEFDTVFVSGLEQGLFPIERSDEKTDSEEERRLFYVAITRARKKLFLSWASFRTIFGSKDVSMPSEFLDDIDDDYLEHLSFNRGKGSENKVEYLIDIDF